MTIESTTAASDIAERLRKRNSISQAFFLREAPRLAEASREMATRFLRGGRLLAFGRGPYATDAQHVSVEFVHPVIVGKRALPALDLSMAYEDWLPAILQPDDMVMGFGPPEGDANVMEMLHEAVRCGAFTFALPGEGADASSRLSDSRRPYQGCAVASPSDDPFIHQEMIEILYHTLWETVHVFLEHGSFNRRERGHDVGASSFLYPYLGDAEQDTESVVADVADSIIRKSEEDERLREEAADASADALAEAAEAINERLAKRGKLICLGNGGSATDANDLAIDCVQPPKDLPPIPAISLSLEPANISAIANDVGAENIFLRQLIAHAQPNDVVVAFSTSGSSKNIIAALKEARKRSLPTIAFTGYDGGDIGRSDVCDHPLIVRTDYIPRIQEIHASLYHVLREFLRGYVHSSK